MQHSLMWGLQPGSRSWGVSGRQLSLVSSRIDIHCVQDAAMEPGTAVFADQFENQANFRAHLKTGEEIWRQTGGRLDAFVSGAGTGGTIAGVSHALKARDPSIQVRAAANSTMPEVMQGTSSIHASVCPGEPPSFPLLKQTGKCLHKYMHAA